MARAASPSKRRSEPGSPHRYRCRVLVAVPPAGFGAQLWVMCAWLDDACGRAGWISSPAGTGGIVNDAVAFYFADADCARAFIRRFCCGYRAVAGGDVSHPPEQRRNSR